MTPRKIIFYTRPWEVQLHINLARRFQELFPDAKVLLASFFAQAVDIAALAGFDTLYFPSALKAVGGKGISDSRLSEIDTFCRREYIGLHAMLHTERFLPAKREDARRFLREHLTVLDANIEENTLSISSMFDHFVYLAGGLIAMEKGGAHFAFVGCGVPAGRVIGLRTPWETWRNHASREDPMALLERAWKEIRVPPEQRIEYMRQPSAIPYRSLGEKLRLRWQSRRLATRDHREGSYFPTHQRLWPLTAFKWRTRALLQRVPDATWDLRGEGDLNAVTGPCVFLALHMEPEATIFMYCPRWRDQLEETRLVAEALPFGYTLLVKENPKMLGRRPRGYYERLRRMPNVRLASLGVPSLSLIERSEAVVSLAGTVTVEARLLGKPAFCFGRPPFYRMASGLGAGISKAEPGMMAV